jgi:hypothetical protein
MSIVVPISAINSLFAFRFAVRFSFLNLSSEICHLAVRFELQARNERKQRVDLLGGGLIIGLKPRDRDPIQRGAPDRERLGGREEVIHELTFQEFEAPGGRLAMCTKNGRGMLLNNWAIHEVVHKGKKL